MSRWKAFYLALAMTCDLGFGYRPAWAWEVIVPGASGAGSNFKDEVRAVTLDPGGNVVAAGRTIRIGTLSDFLVMKLRSDDGAELWRQTINGSADWEDEARAVAVDGNGDVIAAGGIVNTGEGFAVVKFRGSDGAELWRQVIQSGKANAVAVDANGDIVAAGYSATGPLDFFVVKLRGSDGTELWRRVVLGNARYWEEAADVKIDATGDAIVAGRTRNADTCWEFTVVKFRGDNGAELWRRDINGEANRCDLASAVVLDGVGDVIAAGRIETGTITSDFFVVKLRSSDGTEAWRRRISGTANNTNEASAVVVDSAGDVQAAGYVSNTGTFVTRFVFFLVKLSGSDGGEAWRKEILGTNEFESSTWAHSVAVDGAGNAVAAGLISNTGTSGDFFVVKLQGNDGQELWRAEIDGPAHSSGDEAFAVAMDALGNVVAGGRLEAPVASGASLASAPVRSLGREARILTTGDGSVPALAVVKRRGSNGTDFLPSESTPPVGSVRINGGAVLTSSVSVKLTLRASDSSGVYEMCISNATSCSAWELYKTSKPWTLSPGDGTKTVYVWFKDKVGNANSSPFSDQITLDTVAPTNPTSVNSTSHTLNVWSKDRTVDMAWFGAADDRSGVYGYSIKWDRLPTTLPDTTSDTTSTKKTSSSLSDGNKHYFHIRTRDKAGNWTSSAVHLGPFFIDGTAPVNGTLNATAGNGQVSLSWTPFSDAMSGLASSDTYRLVFSTSGTPNSKCTNGTPIFLGTGTSFVHNGLINGTPYYYRVCAFDKVGNVSTGATRSATPQ